jgi:NADPH:quinone reductase
VKALLLKELSGPGGFEPGDIDEPTIDPEKVLIDVEAAGIAMPELLISKGAYQISPPLPFVAGQEVAGVVRAAPAGGPLAPGDRVWAYTGTGGQSAAVSVDPGRVFPLAAELDFIEGAALASNFMTAIFALGRRGHLQADETVLVLGAGGGLGSACVSVAKAIGARVIANVSTEEKAEIARRAGADEVVLGSEWRDQVMAMTEGEMGVDVVADIVGGDETLQAVRATAPEGRVIILGFTTGSIHEVKVNRLLLRNISVVGAGLGAFQETKDPDVLDDAGTELNRLIGKGMRPIVGDVYPIEEGVAAFEQLDRRAALGKIVLTL